MSLVANIEPHDVGAEMLSPLVASTDLSLPANVTSSAFSHDGRTCAAALGDGSVSFVNLPTDAVTIDEVLNAGLGNHKLHAFAAVAIEPFQDGFVTAGQDGIAFNLHSQTDQPQDLESKELIRFPGEWIEVLVVHDDAGLIGFAAGKAVAVTDGAGSMCQHMELPQTISGLTFDSTGKRIAASHYDGVSIVNLDTGAVDLHLDWKGSHVGVSWSPCDRYIVTATQEKELHVWDLVTMADFRMGGYPRKVHQMSWSCDGNMLACSGADVITAWSFAGAGPGGRPPVEIGYVFGGTVTSVAAHPSRALMAGGFTSGNVLIGATGKGEAVVGRARTDTPVSSLAWSPIGSLLAAGDTKGCLSLFAVSNDLKVS
ncbi:MAG: WD40 repeat domain-containing protein [Hyphomicrobiaceae bacterium]